MTVSDCSRHGIPLVLLSLCLLAAAACEQSEPQLKHWNVLVLVPDTVRGDHLSINGYARNTSPNIDALAREGVNFTTAVTVAPRTAQSFASILTGLYPTRHGVRFLFDDPIRKDTPTIGSLFRQAGYEAAAIHRAGFGALTQSVGFDEFLAVDHQRAMEVKNIDVATFELVSEWIFRERSRPFVAFCHFMGAHWPYEADESSVAEFGHSCEGHDHRFNTGGYGIRPLGIGKGVELIDPEAFRKMIWTANLDAKTLEHMIVHYDAEIRTFDTLVGELIESMRDSGLLERTIVVVTSDHGESFGEHGYLQHGPRVDEPVMSVPLVVRLPRGHPDYNPGLVVNEVVRVIDVLPTLLDAAGAEVPDDIDGVSLMPLIRSDGSPTLWAYGEAGRSFMGMDPERHYPGIEGKHRMIRSGNWKLVFIPGPGGGESRLYDLRADPSEQRNLAAENPDKVRELRAHLDEIFANEEVVGGRERTLSAEEIKELRALGYMD